MEILLIIYIAGLIITLILGLFTFILAEYDDIESTIPARILFFLPAWPLIWVWWLSTFFWYIVESAEIPQLIENLKGK